MVTYLVLPPFYTHTELGVMKALDDAYLPSKPQLHWAVYHTNIVIAILFLGEMVCKMSILTLKGYFADPWNTFDCVTTLVGDILLS